MYDFYITDNTVALAAYDPALDNADCYACWWDEETQQAYNSRPSETFEEYQNRPIRSRFLATIIRCADNARIGSIFLSPEGTEPDLAIMLYRPYRKMGYGTLAFSLGLRHCFETFGFEKIYAGCYEGNVASSRMLKKCGFVPHTKGNVAEKHYLTGEPITQYDYVIFRSSIKKADS